MYLLEYTRSAVKDFKRITPPDKKFIVDSLLLFAEHFSGEYERELMRTGKIKKLKGTIEPIYRLRLRSYRVIYKKEEDRLVILVLSVTTREGAYR